MLSASQNTNVAQGHEPGGHSVPQRSSITASQLSVFSSTRFLKTDHTSQPLGSQGKVFLDLRSAFPLSLRPASPSDSQVPRGLSAGPQMPGRQYCRWAPSSLGLRSCCSSLYCVSQTVALVITLCSPDLRPADRRVRRGWCQPVRVPLHCGSLQCLPGPRCVWTLALF